VDAEHLAVPGVRGLQPYQPGKPVEVLERELGIRDAVKLASNENPLGPPPAALAAVRAAAGQVARYPDGSGHRLRHALAERLGVGADQVTLGNGSNDVLELAARCFIAPGDEAVYSEHAFAVYPLVVQAVGGVGRVAPARDYGHDLEAMAALVTPRTRVMFIANPNNPTGTWVEAAALDRLLAALPREVVVVLDEAYHEYVEDPAYPRGHALVGDHPNLLVTRTFSKIYGLAGLRVGYGVSSPQLADLLNRVRQPFNVNSLGLAAAEAALGDEAHVARSRAVNGAGLAQLQAGLDRLGLHWLPSAGNFITFHTPQPAGEVYRALLERGVIVRPVDNYGLPDHLRVTVGTEEDNHRFLAALGEALGAAGA